MFVVQYVLEIAADDYGNATGELEQAVPVARTALIYHWL